MITSTYYFEYAKMKNVNKYMIKGKPPNNNAASPHVLRKHATIINTANLFR